MNTAPLIDRFWAKVEKTKGCWFWLGGNDGTDGYGRLRLSGARKYVQAHRLSWEIHFGKVPYPKLVLHKCDNPACVRPSHLFLGTWADNSSDMVQKKRQAYGEKNGNAKATHDLVRKIRAAHYQRSKKLVASLAKRFGLSYSATWDILKGRVWNGPYARQKHCWLHV